MIEDLINKHLSCNTETGQVFWKEPNGTKCKAGTEAGSMRSDGRVFIRLKGHQLYRYRVVWYFATGKYPKKQIDHKDRNKANDSYSNLREVSNELNSWNKGANCNNKTGYKGVYQSGNRFIANIHMKGKTKYLGTFPTALDAFRYRELVESDYIKSLSEINQDSM